MKSAEEQFQQKFNSLRAQFLEQLPEKINTLNNQWQAVKDSNWSTESASAFRLSVHSLIGTSGTFNFSEISTTARELETLVKTVAEKSSGPEQSEKELIEQVFFTLCNEMLIKPGNVDDSTSPTNECSKEDSKILIVDDDIETISLLEDHLKLHGFIVQTLSHPGKLLESVEQFNPSLILMDMVFEEGVLAGAAAIEVLRDNNHLTPVIFISVNEDMLSRLNAIRTGAHSYLNKPLDLNLLVSNIRSACNIKPNLPYKVLLVDDDPDVLEVHASALVSDGMEVRTVTDPMQTLSEVRDFKPELILLDMHMPKCSGLEVAMILRQCSEFDDIPIVFLSSEHDISIRMMVIKSGSDDFITKPVNLDYLKRAVQARIERSRKILAAKKIDKNTIATIKKEKELALRANRTKSEFISKMSHELRTPLNSILGYAQLLELNHDNTLTEQQKNNVSHILGSGWHLLNLINDVLDTSKIESGYLSLVNTGININDVIKKSIEMSSRHNVDKNINITYDNNYNTNVLVYADATRLQQVIVNILSNAAKFNVDNGEIHITVALETDKTCKVTVKDSGMGLPEDVIHKLFVPFHRLGREKTNIEGSGIGLALSAQLIELMDGEIGAYNNEESGASFWFSLKQYNQDTDSIIDSNSTQKKIKILYIEENKMEIELVRQSLSTNENIELFVARDAESALHVASQIKPDIILLDIELSSMDGPTMLSALRTKQHLQKTPVFALSANDIPPEKQALNEDEFHCYFSKPYNMAKLLKSIEQAL